MVKKLILGSFVFVSVIIIFLFYFFLPVLTPPKEGCENFKVYSKNFSEPARAGIYVGLKLRYPPDWELFWVDENTIQNILQVAIIPSSEKAQDKQSHMFAVTVSLPTSSQPQTLDELTNFLISQRCEKVLEIINISFKEIPARKIKCEVDREKPGVILDFHFIDEREIRGYKVPVIYSLTYVAESQKYDDYINQVNKMIECFEIV